MVRSQQKADFLQNLFEDHAERLEFAIVEDFTVPGAFDTAILEGKVSGIIHCGTPMPTVNTQKDPASYITPAIEGTLEVLKSASRSRDVARVVYTSSVAAVMEPGGNPSTYTEDMWSEGFVKLVDDQGAKAPSLYKYFASKVKAEQAAWEYVNAGTHFDLVTTLPTLIWGVCPSLSGRTSYELSSIANYQRNQACISRKHIDWNAVNTPKASRA